MLTVPGPPPRVLPLHPGCSQAIQTVYEDTDMSVRKIVVTHWLADFSFPSFLFLMTMLVDPTLPSVLVFRVHQETADVCHGRIAWRQASCPQSLPAAS